MARNYGLGARDMARAGRYGLQNAARRGELSYQSAATIAERWNLFSTWARDHDVRRMERVTSELVVSYGREMADAVRAGTLAPATAQNRLSALNTVMGMATQGRWISVSPVRDAGIPKRSGVRTQVPTGMDRREVARATQSLSPRAAAVVDLCRSLGLRAKEASLIDARAALAQGCATGCITIAAGTKGGRSRELPATPQQLQALSRAADVQGNDRSMIPAQETWKSWRAGELRQAREMLQNHGITRLHDLRASYACDRYQALTGSPAPVVYDRYVIESGLGFQRKLGGFRATRQQDLEARQQIAAELGHGRTGITTAYLGGISR